MRLRPVVAAVLATGLLGLTSCRREGGPQDGVRVETTITPQPARVGPAEVEVRVQTKDGRPEVQAGVEVEADMAHPGMEPVFARAVEGEPGVYRTRVDLRMAGDWVLSVQVRLADGVKVERRVDVRGVRPN